MTSITLKAETLEALEGKVVVITGSANGIGAATVSLLHRCGAKVIHGDWNAWGAHQLDTSLSSPNIEFVFTDVTDYESILDLFDTAWKKYGRVDVAISNAGVQEVGNWFDPGEDLETIRTKPPNKVIDINLTGTLYFARIAAVYLKQDATPNEDKSLVFLSSTAGFKETPGLFNYTASKHGVLGLMRSLRPYLIKTHNIRVNAICPWMTDTGMVEGIREKWIGECLPVNTPEMVARVILEVAVGRREKGMGKHMVGETETGRWNGRAVFVEGGRAWDIEEGVNDTEKIWLGEEVSGVLEKGQQVLGDGTDWVKPQTKSK